MLSPVAIVTGRLKNKGNKQLSGGRSRSRSSGSDTIQVTRTPKDPKRVKSMNVKVSKDCHNLIGSMGRVKEDFGDVVYRALRHYISCKYVQEDGDKDTTVDQNKHYPPKT
jgi:hypothetical protein